MLWAFYSHEGGSSDSNYFKETRVYTKFHEIRDILHGIGYYILGDLVYTVEYFLLPLYNQS